MIGGVQWKAAKDQQIGHFRRDTEITFAIAAQFINDLFEWDIPGQ